MSTINPLQPTRPVPPPQAPSTSVGPTPEVDKFSRQETSFGGAYYRKVTSAASSDWKGIQLEGVLPQVNLDPARATYNGDKNDLQADPTAGPLDRPSVYTGGHGDGNREVDCGLSWDRVWNAPKQGSFTDKTRASDDRDPSKRYFEDTRNGQPVVLDGTGAVRAEGQAQVTTFLADKQMDFAFRPFIRDSQGHWITPQPPGSANDRYFYPGEDIKMTLTSVDATHLQLEVDLVGSDYSYKQVFAQDGFGPGTQPSFKRVNSIDQFRLVTGPDGKPARKGNEGRSVIPTSTVLSDADWNKASMLTREGGQVPMVGQQFTEVAGSDVFSHYDQIFKVSPTTSQGGEEITIDPRASA